MFMFLLFLVLTVMILIYVIFYVVSYKNMLEMENLTSYECGFDLISSVRNLFSYRFFLVSLLFLIFDVEIALMLVVPYYSSLVMSLGFSLFILILILGLLYEFNHGMLDWL